MPSTRQNPRYAVYFVPDPGTALYEFGASALGYDCYAGSNTALIKGAEAFESWKDYVHAPRAYGFHATLKAPFYLADGSSEADLVNAIATFAADHAAVVVGQLVVRELDAFIALVPDAQQPLLDRLAQACVQVFDRFRAPMSAQERERRLAAGLSPAQITNLDRWGYPHVADDFRFHMTLTGALAAAERNRVLQFLCDQFDRIRDARSLVVDQLVVARQADSTSPFQVIRVAPLNRSACRPFAHSF